MHTTESSDRHNPTGRGATAHDPDRSRHAPPAAEHDSAVEVRGLRCFYGDFEAVRGIDLLTQRGELLAVLGTNGAGKTTTLEALEGRRAADGGQVRVLGLDPHRQRRRLATCAGVVLQESALPDELTPVEFLKLWHRMAGGGTLRHRPLDEQLIRVGLDHRRDVRIGRLSGGERRRLDLAAALSADPELLFLDEPTAGLDPESRADTWELIRELLRAGTTVVLTTHYLEEAEVLADRLAILHEGAVAVAGTLEEVIGAREARIRCEIARGAVVPQGQLAGQVVATHERNTQRLEVRTPDLSGDLRSLLAWSDKQGIPLHRLHASDPTLAEVFHDIRGTTTLEEVST